MSPEATWSLIGAVGLLVVFLTVALMRTPAQSDRMNERWIERYRLTAQRAGEERAADGLPRRPVEDGSEDGPGRGSGGTVLHTPPHVQEYLRAPYDQEEEDA